MTVSTSGSEADHAIRSRAHARHADRREPRVSRCRVVRHLKEKVWPPATCQQGWQNALDRLPIMPFTAASCFPLCKLSILPAFSPEFPSVFGHCRTISIAVRGSGTSAGTGFRFVAPDHSQYPMMGTIQSPASKTDGDGGPFGFSAPLSCISCRCKKLKCDRRQPSCSRCLASYDTCRYPAARQRNLGKRESVRELRDRIGE